MNNPTKYLALVLCSMTLVACGGGGGDNSAGAVVPVTDVLVVQPASFPPLPPPVPDAFASLAAIDLKPYEGNWKQACVSHKQITTVLVFEDARVFTASPRKDYFENADCTGAIVAVGSYDTYREKVTVAENLQAASVVLVSGSASVARDVNPAVSIVSTTSYKLFNVSGNGVTIDNSIPGIPVTYVNYPDGSKEVFLPEPKFDGGNTTGALLIESSEFLTLNVVIADSPAYSVNQRFYR